MFYKSLVFSALLVVVATSSMVSPFSKALAVLKSSNGVKSYLKSEEEHFCGFYSTGCASSELLSTIANVTLYGSPNSDPVAMDLALDTFIGDACLDEVEVLGFILHTSLVASNDVEKQYVATLNKVSVKISKMTSMAYKCTEPIEAGKIYDVEKLQCKDSDGNDPFADARAAIGQSMPMSVTFKSNSVSLVMEEVDFQAAYLDSTGCKTLPFWMEAVSTTSTPTPSPSAQPTTVAPSAEPTTLAPTTVAPSAEPTTLAPTTVAPTTVAPTAEPTTTAPSTDVPTEGPTTVAPTTVAPTTVTPTTVTPTEAPTTVTPTVAPTTPVPTAAPTTPVPTPSDNKLLMYGLIGGGVLVVLILVICCCCCGKKKDKKRARVRRMKFDENSPLVKSNAL